MNYGNMLIQGYKARLNGPFSVFVIALHAPHCHQVDNFSAVKAYKVTVSSVVHFLPWVIQGYYITLIYMLNNLETSSIHFGGTALLSLEFNIMLLQYRECKGL